MPLVRKNQQLEKVTLDDVLKDNDEVYYCEISNEIFRNYEEYFERVMFLNSTVWTCALTSRPNLTYSEALESEKSARRVLRKFAYELKAPLVFIASLTKRRGILDLVEDVFAYVSTRFFREETVNVRDKECQVMSIVFPVAPDDCDDPLALQEIVDPAIVQYKVRRNDVISKKLQEPFIALAKDIRRPRAILSKDKLKLFMKHCVEFNDHGYLSIKESVYNKFVIDGGVRKFTDFWVGLPPKFEVTKALQNRLEKEEKQAAKKKNKDVKPVKTVDKAKKTPEPKSKEKSGKEKNNGKLVPNQPAISNYFAKDDGTAVSPSPATIAKNEQLLRMRKEKEEQEAADKRNQIEEMKRINTMVAAAIRTFNRTGEDLELQDQRMLPYARPVKTLIPNEFLADAMFVLEFVYSFSELLENRDKFPKGYSLDLLQRSILFREVAGPLSDTIQVLLGTIFSLHLEEASEVVIDYVNEDFFDECKTVLHTSVKDATLAVGWAKRYLSMDLHDLPMDSNTVSELLRLHLLTSGARAEDECAKWRYQQRGGYRNEDDPGLIFRLRHPHILKLLASKTVYELETADIMRILLCLINQIVTYSTIRDAIEERLSNAHAARTTLRSVVAAERKREHALQVERRTLNETYKKDIASFVGDAEAKKKNQEKLAAQLENNLKALDIRMDKGKAAYNENVQQHRREIFSYQLLLGNDRAYRSYWLFESLPGLFVEWPNADQVGDCLSAPTVNYPTLSRCSASDRNQVIRQIVMDTLNTSDKENNIDNTDAKKTTQKQPLADANGAVKEVDVDVDNDEASDQMATELLMCTGEADSCPVHGSRSEWRWAFLSNQQELDALIAALNPHGTREKVLKEQLETDRELILNHINSCEESKLNLQEDQRDRQMKALLAMPNYTKANLGFPAEANVPTVVEGTLVDLIVKLERRVTEGHLGKLHVADLEKWRDALTFAIDDGQSADLRWGPDDAFSKDNRTPTDYVDPGQCLDCDTDPADPDVLNTRQRVFFIARSLLQVAQSIDQQFLRAPFGVQNRNPKTQAALLEKGRQALLMWQVSLMNATSHAQVFLHYTILEDAIIWSRSSLNATCKVCRRRVMPEKMLLCDGCNGGRHLFCFKPKLLKVPEGQWFCQSCKPPEPQEAHSGKKRANKRKIFNIVNNSSESDEEGFSDMSDNDDLAGRRKKLSFKPTKQTNLEWNSDTSDEEEEEIVQSEEVTDEDDIIEIPAKKATVTSSASRKRSAAARKTSGDEEDSDTEVLAAKRRRGSRTTTKRKRSSEVEEDDDDDDDQEEKEEDEATQPDDDDEDFQHPNYRTKKSIGKRAKSERTKRTSSRRSTNDDEHDDRGRKSNGRVSSSRRSRRVDDDNDNVLLDTVACYDLLADVAKHKDVWPFDRPVNKVDVPDYYTVISTPMDLAKIKSKLNLGEYRTNYDIMKDIQQIFINCDLYNSSGSEIFNAGVRVEKFIRDRCAALKLPFKCSDMLNDEKATSASITSSSTNLNNSRRNR